jgi:hypothetical protein
MSRGRRL